MKERVAHEALSHRILGAAMTVLNELKPGLDEKVYENALVIEFQCQGIPYAQQTQFPVLYRGKTVGKLIPDLIADGKIIVDAKVVSAFNEAHIAQMIGYLTITGLEVGLLISFKESKLQWKRILRPHRLPPSVPSV